LIILAVELNADLNVVGRVRLALIPDASAGSIVPLVKDNVVPGATVISDGWRTYQALKKEGFNHIISTKKSDDDLLPHVHMVVSLLKRWLLGTYQCGVQKKYLGFYLDEYVFRFNRRKSSSRGKLFMRFFEQAVATPPVTRKNIIIKDLNEQGDECSVN
jgi:transposase-like protein